MIRWFANGALDIFKEPYNQNRKLFKVTDFQKKKLILEIDTEFIVRYSKGFPRNDVLYGYESD